MYSDIFCKVYNEFGWNYYPETFGEQLLEWLEVKNFYPDTSLDLACGTGVLCEILHAHGIRARGMDLASGMIDVARSRNQEIIYEVADMVSYRPEGPFDLVTCTGDAFNHILDIGNLQQIFENIHGYMTPGGWLVFDILNEREVSTSEPFEMDFDEHTRVWFQMTQPEDRCVNLQIKVYEDRVLTIEENIREKIHDPVAVCNILRDIGYQEVVCMDRLLEKYNKGTTWFITAKKGIDTKTRKCHYFDIASDEYSERSVP